MQIEVDCILINGLNYRHVDFAELYIMCIKQAATTIVSVRS